MDRRRHSVIGTADTLRTRSSASTATSSLRALTPAEQDDDDTTTKKKSSHAKKSEALRRRQGRRDQARARRLSSVEDVTVDDF